MEIKQIKAKKIFDSRGRLTLEVGLQTEGGIFPAAVPSGTSVGIFEAKSLKAAEAIKNINEVIGPALKKKKWANQKELDEFLISFEGTPDKSRLGANALLAVSLAASRAFARQEGMSLFQYLAKIFQGTAKKISLPKPCFLMIEGKRHAVGFGCKLDVQEFMVVPQEKDFGRNLQMGREIYQTLGKFLGKEFGRRKVKKGLEGGYSGPFKKTEEALDFIRRVVAEIGWLSQVRFYLDFAASEFYEEGKYKIDGREMTVEETVAFYKNLAAKYSLTMLEDPFSEDDWKAWRKLKSFSELLVIGDDLTVTNPARIKKAAKEGICNAVILKPNQIGTVSETLEAARLAKSFGWQIIVSHRSGETKDDFIADLAVGCGADFIKSGAPAPPERMAKYNRLLAIEKQLVIEENGGHNFFAF